MTPGNKTNAVTTSPDSPPNNPLPLPPLLTSAGLLAQQSDPKYPNDARRPNFIHPSPLPLVICLSSQPAQEPAAWAWRCYSKWILQLSRSILRNFLPSFASKRFDP